MKVLVLYTKQHKDNWIGKWQYSRVQRQIYQIITIINGVVLKSNDTCQYVNIDDLSITSCRECKASENKVCRYRDPCKFNDDVDSVSSIIQNSDSIIIVSPYGANKHHDSNLSTLYYRLRKKHQTEFVFHDKKPLLNILTYYSKHEYTGFYNADYIRQCEDLFNIIDCINITEMNEAYMIPAVEHAIYYFIKNYDNYTEYGFKHRRIDY